MTTDQHNETAGGVALEWSHGRVRTVTRADEVPAIPSAEAVPIPRNKSGRFAEGNRAWRLRQAKDRAEGIATLNPDKAPSWLRPFIEQGAAYVASLVALLDSKPALLPLAGDCADAHVMYRALFALALQSDGPARVALLAESRGWLREHRTALATLSKLAGSIRLPQPDPHAALAEGLAGDDEPETDAEEPDE